MPSGTWALGWIAGDIVTAAEFKKGMGAIYDSTAGGPVANFDITPIVGSYAHLLIEVYGRGDTAAVTTGLLTRFNNDTAANYDYQLLSGSAAAAAASETFAATSMLLGNIPANTAGANLFGSTSIKVHHYAGSANNKTAVAEQAYKFGVATTNMTVFKAGGFWRSSAAITRVTLLPAAGNFVAGSRVTVYAEGA